MKKIISILLCAMLVCMMSLVAFAEEADVEQPPAEEIPEETPEETPEEIPEEVPEDGEGDNEKPDSQIEAELTTEKLVNWVKGHLEEISVIVTMILTVFYQVRKYAALDKSMSTMNNNTVTVSENSSKDIKKSLESMNGVALIVDGYKTQMENLLTEVRANEEEKHKLAAALAEVNKNLQTSKAANIEFANELAELLVLANIPNSKKDELYARHRAAVDAIVEAERTEVKEDDRQEA